MNRVEEINAGSHAKGWYASMLMKEAERNGETMATAFRRRVTGSAYSVPATCTKVTSMWVFYRFADGSRDRYPNQNGE